MTKKVNEWSSYLIKGEISKIFEKRSIYNGRKEIYVNISVSGSILVGLIQVASTNFITKSGTGLIFWTSCLIFSHKVVLIRVSKKSPQSQCCVNIWAHNINRPLPNWKVERDNFVSRSSSSRNTLRKYGDKLVAHYLILEFIHLLKNIKSAVTYFWCFNKFMTWTGIQA